MRLNVTLRRRVERVEKRQRERTPLPTIIMGIYAEEQPGPILGIEGNGKLLRVEAGQSLAELKRIAAATLPGRFLRIAYGAAGAAPELAGEPSAPAPINAPVAAPRAVPGVGRMASREELIRMGAVPVPPERESGP